MITNNIDTEALNKKLALWIGVWRDEDGNYRRLYLPDEEFPSNALIITNKTINHTWLSAHFEDKLFTNSLDRCFKYLIPKLRELGYYATIQFLCIY